MGTWKGMFAPPVVAAVYARAAALVDRHGYNGRVQTRLTGEPYSAALAVERAAAEIYLERRAELGADTMDFELVDDASDRLTGLLAFCGLAAPGGSMLSGWDLASPRHDQAETVAMLGMASFATGFIASRTETGPVA